MDVTNRRNVTVLPFFAAIGLMATFLNHSSVDAYERALYGLLTQEAVWAMIVGCTGFLPLFFKARWLRPIGWLGAAACMLLVLVTLFDLSLGLNAHGEWRGSDMPPRTFLLSRVLVGPWTLELLLA